MIIILNLKNMRFTDQKMTDMTDKLEDENRENMDIERNWTVNECKWCDCNSI